MSLLSPHLGTAVPATGSGQSSIEDLYAKLTVAAAVFLVLHEIGVVVFAGWPPAGTPWLDHQHFVFGRDFLNTWLGGRSIFFGGPAPWFDFRVYNQAIQQILGVPYPVTYWSYPPHIVLFAWPFGLMPYLPAYIAWCAIGIALYLFVCSSAVPRDRLLFLAVAPGIAVCIFFGQNGFYTAALLIGGLLNRERRPVLAGILFGILTIKPQLGLLVPVVLLLERRWLTIAAAAVTAAVLVAFTAMLFGWSVWIAFWQQVVPQQVWLTETSDGLLYSMVASAFYGARLIDLPLSVAWDIQYVVATLAFAAVVWAYWKRRDPALSLALFVTATFLFTPYILNYDMVVFGFVVALLRDRTDNTMRDHWLLIAIWTLPVTMMLSAIGRVPLAPIVLIAFAVWLIRRMMQSDSSEVRLPSPEPASVAA
jgi:alpha-1,2-mannosyltransferase